MSDKLALTRSIVQVVSGISVGKVVNDIIQNNTNIETWADMAKVSIGSLVIGSMAADAATTHVGQKMDKAQSWWEKRQAEKASNPS